MFEWLRPIAARSTLRFSATREFTDTSSVTTPDRSSIPDGGDTTTTDVLLSSYPFEQKRFGWATRSTTPRPKPTLDVDVSDERYAGALEPRQRKFDYACSIQPHRVAAAAVRFRP